MRYFGYIWGFLKGKFIISLKHMSNNLWFNSIVFSSSPSNNNYDKYNLKKYIRINSNQADNTNNDNEKFYFSL